MTIFALTLLTGLGACSEHKVDTFPEWCEQIRGVDLNEKYAPFWSVIPSVSFNGEDIRDDFVKFLNSTYLEKIQNRAPKMAWRNGTELHLLNLSTFFVLAPEKFIGEWHRGIQKATRYEHSDTLDLCLYGTVTSMFDSLHIHSIELDPIESGKAEKDNVTVIETDRKRRLKDPL